MPTKSAAARALESGLKDRIDRALAQGLTTTELLQLIDGARAIDASAWVTFTEGLRRSAQTSSSRPAASARGDATDTEHDAFNSMRRNVRGRGRGSK